MLIFGLSLVVCYGNSSLYHGVRLGGEPLMRLRRLDHVGIYVLIAGTYTPAAWSLMKAAWRRGTLAIVWCVAGLLRSEGLDRRHLAHLDLHADLPRHGLGGALLLPGAGPEPGPSQAAALAAGGIFYSVGALINLSHWPVVWPGVFGSHELFHFFVIAGSACHVAFMLRVVVPARAPAGWLGDRPGVLPTPRLLPLPLASLGRWRRWPPAWAAAGSGSRSSSAKPSSAVLTSRGKTASRPGRGRGLGAGRDHPDSRALIRA